MSNKSWSLSESGCLGEQVDWLHPWLPICLRRCVYTMSFSLKERILVTAKDWRGKMGEDWQGQEKSLDFSPLPHPTPSLNTWALV